MVHVRFGLYRHSSRQSLVFYFLENFIILLKCFLFFLNSHGPCSVLTQKSIYNQSILKEISPEYSLEGLMLKLKLPIVWPPDAKNWLIWKDPDAGKDWRQEEKGTTEDEIAGWYHRLNGHECVNSGSWWWTERPGVLQSMGSQRVRHNWATELNWTDLPNMKVFINAKSVIFSLCT